MKLPPPKLPREHGAWAMLALPLILGLVATGAGRPTSWSLVAACLLAFLAHYALVPLLERRRTGRDAAREWWLRRSIWGAVYLLSALGAFGWTLRMTPPGSRPDLLVVAGVAAGCATIFALARIASRRRQAWSELIGMVGLSLSPAMMALARGAAIEGETFGPTVLSYAYFVSSLSFVRAYEARMERSAVVACVAIHVVMTLGLVGAAAAEWLVVWAPVAYAPVLVRTALGIAFPPPSLRGLGFREIVVSVVYAVLCAVALT